MPAFGRLAVTHRREQKEPLSDRPASVMLFFRTYCYHGRTTPDDRRAFTIAQCLSPGKELAGHNWCDLPSLPEPPIGIEPMTCSLRVSRSAD